MPETKYGKYILREPIVKGTYGANLHICGERHGDRDCEGAGFAGFPCELSSMCIAEPFVMPTPSHAHDYDQLLCFIGGNPRNIFDFGAEVEIALGPEEEKHIINTTCMVYIPKGMMHCPLNFKKVEKPFTFMHICFSPRYTRSQGELTGHPERRLRYPAEEAAKLRGKPFLRK
jgi:hypothetical protein